MKTLAASSVVRPADISADISFFSLIETRAPAIIRWALLAYVLIYRVLTPGVVALTSNEIVAYLPLRVVTAGLAELIAVAPVVFLRGVGLFHPLAFPVLFVIAFDIAFQPFHLLFPFLLSAKPIFSISPSWSVYLGALSDVEYSLYQSYFSSVTVLFSVSTISGFYITKVRAPVLGYSFNSRALSAAAGGYVILAIASGWAFIRVRGGVEAQILSFYEGRFESLSGFGVFTVITKVSSVAVLLWLAASKNAERSILFWILFVALLPVYWLVDGSRSSVIVMLMTMLIVYSLKHRKIPFVMASWAAVVAFVIFGLLGLLRQDYHAEAVDFSVFDLKRASEWIAASQGETNKRAEEEGDLAAFVAAHESGLLLGKSYLSVLAYPVPRALWPEKPKNIFTYNTWVAFMGNSDDDVAPEIWGIPANSVSEAYWNFNLPGVVFVGLLVGGGLRFGFNLFKANPTIPWVPVLYIQLLLYFNGGSRWMFYLIQNLVGLFIILFMAKFIDIVFYRRRS